MGELAEVGLLEQVVFEKTSLAAGEGRFCSPGAAREMWEAGLIAWFQFILCQVVLEMGFGVKGPD